MNHLLNGFSCNFVTKSNIIRSWNASLKENVLSIFAANRIDDKKLNRSNSAIQPWIYSLKMTTRTAGANDPGDVMIDEQCADSKIK